MFRTMFASSQEKRKIGDKDSIFWPFSVIYVDMQHVCFDIRRKSTDISFHSTMLLHVSCWHVAYMKLIIQKIFEQQIVSANLNFKL